MSSQYQPKITSKNLAYSNDLPPFLAKLHGQQQHQRNSDSPDPILAARRRAARPRSASEEAEDAPLVVDEAGNTIAFPSAADADAPGDGDVDDKDGKDSGVAGNRNEKEKEREKEKIAGIGAGKKRKVGRVVGGGEEEDDGAEKPTRPTARTEKESPSKNKKETKHVADPNSKDVKSGSKQGKKKAKKIKLSFGDDGD